MNKLLRRFAPRGVFMIIGFYIFSSLRSLRFGDQLLLSVDLLLDQAVVALLPSLPSFRDDLAHSQSTLSCFVQEGKWGWGSNSWPTFTPNRGCLQDTPAKLALLSPNPTNEICKLLVGRRLLFVGPESTYYLHTLWLASLESYENRSHTCLGQRFCTFHHICRLPSSQNNFGRDEISGRKKKIPSANALLATKSSILRFSLSTNLHTSDQYSGVRPQNTHWLKSARRSDVVVMNRGPIPAPGWTYPTDGNTANWTFAVDLCGRKNYLGNNDCTGDLEQLLVNAALHATLNIFLPDLLLSLGNLLADFELRKTRLFWHGSWYIQPLCAKFNLPNTIPLLRGILPKSPPVDPWSFYYNSQGESLTSNNSYLRC
ncbi:hypothetical protein M413DRAFT_333906 [Hebeloma cylindrosporum]|uniref:Uncharacterized protein n=1 Tax=Hebeloma cylindrosporum TaxID=76867 RepID=A0A0C3C8P1_HEBCY|nr:hypothetical protein M413DRAFT_333906 [Hebeloma cylindrosporum h7]